MCNGLNDPLYTAISIGLSVVSVWAVSLLGKKSSDYLFCLCESGLEIIIDEGVVEFACCEFHLGSSLGNALLDSLHSVCAAAYESFAENLYRRSLDEDGEGLLAEDPLEVHASLYIDVEDDRVAFCPDTLHF